MVSFRSGKILATFCFFIFDLESYCRFLDKKLPTGQVLKQFNVVYILVGSTSRMKKSIRLFLFA